jgi:hypothetical protein
MDATWLVKLGVVLALLGAIYFFYKSDFHMAIWRDPPRRSITASNPCCETRCDDGCEAKPVRIRRPSQRVIYEDPYPVEEYPPEDVYPPPYPPPPPLLLLVVRLVVRSGARVWRPILRVRPD